MLFLTSVFVFATQSIASGIKRYSSEMGTQEEAMRAVYPRPIDYQREYDSFLAATDPHLLALIDNRRLITAEESELLYGITSDPSLALRMVLDNGDEFGNKYLVHRGNTMFFYNQIAANLGVAPKMLAKGSISLSDFAIESDDEEGTDDEEASYVGVDALLKMYPFRMDTNELIEAIQGHWSIVPIIMEKTGPCLDTIKKRRGSIPLSEALHIGIQMMQSLERIHTVGHLLHGKLKPSNICQSLANPSRYLLTDFSEALIIDPQSAAEIEFPGWRSSEKMGKKTRFTSLWQLSPKTPYGSRDEVWNLLSIVLWLSQPHLEALPKQDDPQAAWDHWKRKFQFTYVDSLNRNKIKNTFKRTLISLHLLLIRLLNSLDSGARPPYQEFVRGLQAIKNLLDHEEI